MKKYFLLFASVLFGVSASNAQITESDNSIDSVVVTGSRNTVDVKYLPYSVSIVPRATLTEANRVSLLPTLNQQVPGLFTTSRGMMGFGMSGGGSGALNIRGLGSGGGQLMVMIDGQPQYQGIYGHSLSDTYQTYMADRVEVLRGPASMLYGSNAMGGVVNIITRKMRADGVRTNVHLGAGSYGTVQTEAENQVRSGKFTSTVAAQYERSDNHRPRMGFEQFGGMVKLGYEFSNFWKASFNANATHFSASNPGTVYSPLYDARQWITRGMLSLAVENNYGWTNGSLRVYDNFGRNKINDGESDPDVPNMRYFRSKDALAGVSLYQSAQLFEGNRTTVGVDYQHIYGRAYYTSRATGKTIATSNKQSGHSHRNEIGAYVDFRQNIWSWLTVDAGVRIDYHSVTGTEWVPQAGVMVRPIKDGELKATVSRGFRNPTMRELYLYPPSNTDLDAESIMNYEISWHHAILDGAFNYGVNLYYINGDNIIETVYRDGRPLNVNSGKIENWGAELEASARLGTHWHLNTNHSFLHMEHHVIAAPEYKGYLGASCEYGKISASAGLQQIARLFTQVGTTEHTQSYMLLNAAVTYKALHWLDIWARGDNLFACKYEVNYGFPMPRATFMAGVNLKF